MRKLVLFLMFGVLIGAAPAQAINDPSVPASACSPDHSQAVGHPAAPVLSGTPAGPVPNPGGSHDGLEHNDRSANCAGGR
jgi:hypothetical protein